MSYYEKYIKYKNKYLELKQIGGGDNNQVGGEWTTELNIYKFCEDFINLFSNDIEVIRNVMIPIIKDMSKEYKPPTSIIDSINNLKKLNPKMDPLRISQYLKNIDIIKLNTLFIPKIIDYNQRMGAKITLAQLTEKTPDPKTIKFIKSITQDDFNQFLTKLDSIYTENPYTKKLDKLSTIQITDILNDIKKFLLNLTSANVQNESSAVYDVEKTKQIKRFMNIIVHNLLCIILNNNIQEGGSVSSNDDTSFELKILAATQQYVEEKLSNLDLITQIEKLNMKTKSCDNIEINIMEKGIDSYIKITISDNIDSNIYKTRLIKNINFVQEYLKHKIMDYITNPSENIKAKIKEFLKHFVNK